MNTRLLSWCATFTLTFGAGLSAQSSPPQPSSSRTTATGAVATVTATGCIERWTSQTTEEQGNTPDEAPAGVEFVLTHVEGQSTASGTISTGKTTKAQPETRYFLLASPSQNLAAHLNHKVTIAGTIAPQPSQGAADSEPAANPASRETNLPEKPRSEAYHYRLVDVASLTMVSRVCGNK